MGDDRLVPGISQFNRMSGVPSQETYQDLYGYVLSAPKAPSHRCPNEPDLVQGYLQSIGNISVVFDNLCANLHY